MTEQTQTDPTFERTKALHMMKAARDRFYALLVEHPVGADEIEINRTELVDAIEDLDDALAESVRAFHTADQAESAANTPT